MIKSAGILLYRIVDEKPEVFIVHPGGPFWAKKDEGAWSIPKGEFLENENSFKAAMREFQEETGQDITAIDPIELTPVRMKSGKLILAWAVKGDADASKIKSNLFEVTFKNGSKKSYPEVDRAAWCNLRDARIKINAAQIPFLDELEQKLGSN